MLTCKWAWASEEKPFTSDSVMCPKPPTSPISSAKEAMIAVGIHNPGVAS